VNLILRLIRVLFVALRRPPLDLLGESVVRFRVWPGDLDFNLHMNNGRYLTLMDLGRVDLMARHGTLKQVHKNRWQPVVAAQTILYRRALKPFQRYSLHNRVVCWDDKFIYLKQRFQTGDKLAASAIVKAAVRRGGRTLRPRELLKAIGQERRSPPMPPAIKAWALAEEWSSEPRGPAAPLLGRPAPQPGVQSAERGESPRRDRDDLRRAG
jgi:acyl-CoA thioesterase FadM